jgi:hypothetical protein
MADSWVDSRDEMEWNISSTPIMEPDSASPLSERDYQVRFRREGESLDLLVCRRGDWSTDDLSDGELQHLLDEARREERP